MCTNQLDENNMTLNELNENCWNTCKRFQIELRL